MALKAELTQWVDGVAAYENRDYENALRYFESIADTSRIHFNIAMTFVNLGALEDAIQALTRAIACDPFLAVAYYMRGVCLYNSNALRDSLDDFNEAIRHLRNNTDINYTQLGLPYTLYAAEVFFNRGLCLAAMGNLDEAYKDWDEALRTRPPSPSTDMRNIDEALRVGDQAPQILGPFAVPADTLYRPPKNKVKNAEKKDYIGKAKVVAAVEATNNYAGFSGRELKLKTLPRANTTGGIDLGTMPSRSARNRDDLPTGLARSATVGAIPTRGLQRSFTTGGASGRKPSPSPLGPANTISRTNTFRERSSSIGGATLPRGYDRDDRDSDRRRQMMSVNPIDELMDELSSPSYDEPRRGPTNNGYRNPRDNLNRTSTVGSVSSYTSSTASTSVKIKAHFTATRILLVPYTITLPTLLSRIAEKFNMGKAGDLFLKYKDEDGEMVMMMDQEDLEVAFAVAGMEWGVEGGSGRLEVWCFLKE